MDSRVASLVGGSSDTGTRSLWLEQAGDIGVRRAPLDGDSTADVIIVGGGLTGLWTAYYLAVADPSLAITVVERATVGFGASGRNGGWASAGIAGSAVRYARLRGWPAVLAGVRATNEAVDEIGRVVATEGIACGWAKQGSLAVAMTTPQLQRLRDWHATSTAHGILGPEERLLDPAEAEAYARIPGTLGGFYTPHCAGMDPARLTRGLARAAERRGVRIVEETEALELGPGRVRTDRGTVRAPVVLRATEAYTTLLPGESRTYLPLTSLMIATEPLGPAAWDEIGMPRGMTVRDRRHLFFYAQRTEDDRMVIGGRGAPYALRMPIHQRNERNAEVRARLAATLHAHFPATRQAVISHHWGGTLAVPRDWSMAVHYDPVSGAGWAGGYAGHGVVAANVAGRTLADLVTGTDSDLVRMPWVGHRSGRWEPEPLRYLASRAIVGVLMGADRHEDRTGRMARRVRLVAPFLPPA
jgi:glycine/D-amino acid oxidase-like deaminating enzyme